ncbi:MAG: hypothetical protein R3F49_09735 [Planctomycetota bacterium]
MDEARPDAALGREVPMPLVLFLPERSAGDADFHALTFGCAGLDGNTSQMERATLQLSM